MALVVGRLAPEKNLPLAARAFGAIREKSPDARLVLVGEGPLRPALQRQHPEIRFTGMLRGEEQAAHYASADVFLFPSLTETFGNVTLEAMASGLPVAAFDDAAARETARMLSWESVGDAFVAVVREAARAGRPAPAAGTAVARPEVAEALASS